MKKRWLTLGRHATAANARSGQSDIDRPLTDAGQFQSTEMGRTLASARAHPPIDLLISSPAARALATSRQYANMLGIDQQQIVTLTPVYEATCPTLLRILNEIDDRFCHAMLVGHNPGVSELAATIAPARFISMQPAETLTMALHCESWEDLTAGSGEMLDYRSAAH